MAPHADPGEKRQSVVLRHLLSWQRVVMGKTVPHFLKRLGLRLNTFAGSTVWEREFLG